MVNRNLVQYPPHKGHVLRCVRKGRAKIELHCHVVVRQSRHQRLHRHRDAYVLTVLEHMTHPFFTTEEPVEQGIHELRMQNGRM